MMWERALALAAGLVFLTSSLQAQRDKENSGNAQIRGCLQRSEGRYILVDQNNVAQRLSDSNKLKKFVGHEVELTGQPRIKTIDTTQAGIASSAIEQPYFEVKAVKDVALSCQSIPR
jgi:hypothetical protein